MKRMIFAVLMAMLFFALLNFVYCNLDEATFSYNMVFKFTIPYLLAVRSVPIPLGFVLLLTFCLGMITIAFVEALPGLFKALELRAKNKKIRQLERELTLVRQMMDKRGEEPVETSPNLPSEEAQDSDKK